MQVDGVVGQVALQNPAVRTAAVLSAWAIGAACAGAADAIIASVLNGEAAALGCNRVSGLQCGRRGASPNSYDSLASCGDN